MRRQVQVRLGGALMLMGMVLLSGCEASGGRVEKATSQPKAAMISSAARVHVGEVTDASPQDARNARLVLGRFDPAAELRARLDEALEHTGRSRGHACGDLTLDAKIVDYRPGNALIRWVLPGTGRTILVVEGRLIDGDGRQVGAVRARRTVAGGDGHTVGQWYKVFGTVAADIAADVRKELQAG